MFLKITYANIKIIIYLEIYDFRDQSCGQPIAVVLSKNQTSSKKHIKTQKNKPKIEPRAL